MTLTERNSPTRDGVLAAGGTCTLRAYVYTGSVPDRAPAEWDERAEPVRDRAGDVVDWRLAPGRVSGPAAADRSAFRRWRADWVTDRVMGDRAEIDGFLDWADHRCDVSLLHVLRLPEASLPWTRAARAAWQASQAVATARSLAETGVGLCSTRRGGLVRGFVTCLGPVRVLAAGDTEVTADADGLLLRQGGLADRVLGWRTGPDGTVVRTPSGEVALGTTPAGTLVRSLAPADHEIVVDAVPLHRLFAGIGLRVPEIARVAQAARHPIVFRYGAAV